VGEGQCKPNNFFFFLVICNPNVRLVEYINKINEKLSGKLKKINVVFSFIGPDLLIQWLLRNCLRVQAMYLVGKVCGLVIPQHFSTVNIRRFSTS
jgi:hypothetical protein